MAALVVARSCRYATPTMPQVWRSVVQLRRGCCAGVSATVQLVGRYRRGVRTPPIVPTAICGPVGRPLNAEGVLATAQRGAAFADRAMLGGLPLSYA